MGWVGTAVAIAGTAISAYGQYRQHESAAQAADYNAQMARYEQDYQKQKAEREEEEHRQKVKRFIGEQTVKGAAGGGTGTGSDFSILLDTLTEAEMDAALIRYGGSVESWKAGAQADLFEHQAKQSRVASFLDPAGTILGGAASLDYGSFKSGATKSSFSPSDQRWSPRKASGFGSTTRWSPRRY